MGIDHGGSDTAVPQQLLDGPDVLVGNPSSGTGDPDIYPSTDAGP